MRKILCCLSLCQAALVAGLTTTVEGRAAPPPDTPHSEGASGKERPSSQPEDPGKVFRAEGNAALNAGRLKEALELWRKAWPHRPHDASLACDIGSTELRLGNDVAAAEWLTRCARLLPPITDIKKVERRRFEVVDLAVAQNRVVTVLLDTEPGAEIIVDGRATGIAPLAEPIFLKPGEHRIEARKGPRSVSTMLRADAGERHRIALSFTPPMAAKPPPSGPATPMLSRSAKPSFVWWPAVLGGAATLTVAGIGAALRVNGEIAKDEAADIKQTILGDPNGAACGDPYDHHRLCNAFQRAEHSRAVNTNASTALFVVSGVLAAGTIGYLAYEFDRVRVSPTLGGVVGSVLW